MAVTLPGNVGCPLCGAWAWEPCLTSGGKPLGNRWHAVREAEARRRDAEASRADA